MYYNVMKNINRWISILIVLFGSMFSILMSLLNRNYNKDITISQNNIIKNLPDFQIIDYLLKNYKHASLENISKEFHYTVPYCLNLSKRRQDIHFQSY